MQLQSVVEEECTGNGTLQCVLSAITAAFRPDAALVTEPFPGAITVSQIGVLWFHIDIAGAPAHVGEAGEGVNAIEAAFPILAALHRLEAELNEAPPAPYDEIDVEELNACWAQPSAIDAWSQFIPDTADTVELITEAPKSGIWRLDPSARGGVRLSVARPTGTQWSTRTRRSTCASPPRAATATRAPTSASSSPAAGCNPTSTS